MLLQEFLCPLILVYSTFGAFVQGDLDHILSTIKPNESLDSITCTAALLRKYFQVHKPLSGYVLSIKLTSQAIDAQDLIIKALQSDPTYPWTLVLLSTSFFANPRTDNIELAEKPMAYFYLMDFEGDVHDVLDMWKSTSNWNPNAQYVLYSAYAEESSQELTELATDLIARILRTQKFYNIFIIGHTIEEDTVYGLTLFPYHPQNSCAKFIQKINIVDTCTNSKATIQISEVESASFEDKYPNDLGYCPLTVGFRSWEPYIFKETTRRRNTSEDNSIIKSKNLGDYKMNGLEYKLLQTIGAVLNLQIVFVAEMNHLFLLYQMIIDNEVDLIFGGIDENPKLSGFVSSAVPHFQDDLTFCVAKGKPTSDLKDILSTMNIIAYALLTLVLLFLTLSLLVSQKLLETRIPQLKDFQITFLRMFGVTFGQGIPLGRIPFSIQFLLVCSFYMGLLLTNIFQSVLVSNFASDKRIDQVSRIQDIYEKNIQVMGGEQIVYFLDKEGEVYEAIRKNFKVCDDIDVCLRNAANNSQLAVAVPRQHVNYNPRITRDQLYCFDREENIYSYLVAMLLPKNFHLLYKIDPIIYSLIESGLFYKWASDMENGRIERKNSYNTKEPKQLTMQDIIALWTLGSLWLSFSSLLFILEITTHYLVVRKNKRIKVFIFLHKKLFKQNI